MTKESLEYLANLAENYDKIAQDRIEYGYDSICLRVRELTDELAYLKAKNSDRDFEYWRNFYFMRASRIYAILDDLLDNKGRSN